MMLDRIRQFVKHRTPVPRWIERSKKLILPGFDGMPLYDVLAFFIQGLRKGALTMRASSLAFKFFLALFPAIIFVFTLIPYIPIDQFQDQLLLQLESILPTEAYVLTKSTIEDLINRERSGLLSFGFILTLYFASNGMNAMISAFNQSYHTSEKRSVFRQRLVSLLLIGILTLLVLVSVVLIIFSKFVIGYLEELLNIDGRWDWLLVQSIKWIAILALFYFSIGFIYYLAPSRKSHWRFFSAGSSLATGLIIAVSSGFAYYVNHFGQFNKLYGSIGTLIVIMLWIYFNCIILLIGFELNASIKEARGQNAALPDQPAVT